MKVAFTTEDSVHINAHFGWAKHIVIYKVLPSGYEFSSCLSFEGDLKEDGNEGKIVPKIEALSDCAIVYLNAIGPSAAAYLVKKRIHPVKVKEDEKIQDILDKFVHMLNSNPPPWIRKILHQEQKVNKENWMPKGDNHGL